MTTDSWFIAGISIMVVSWTFVISSFAWAVERLLINQLQISIWLFALSACCMVVACSITWLTNDRYHNG